MDRSRATAVAMMSAPLWPANSSTLAAAHTLPAVAASTEAWRTAPVAVPLLLGCLTRSGQRQPCPSRQDAAIPPTSHRMPCGQAAHRFPQAFAAPDWDRLVTWDGALRAGTGAGLIRRP